MLIQELYSAASTKHFFNPDGHTCEPTTEKISNVFKRYESLNT